MPPASRIELDDSLWPLLFIRLTSNITLADLEAFLAKRLEYMQRHEPHVLLYDTREFRLPTNTLTQRYLEWNRQHELLARETVLASSVVIISPLIRLTASTLIHFWPPRQPYHFAATLPDAARWASDQLQMAGYPLQANNVRQRFAP